jgi:excisionase family DNA binding protein
MDAQLPSPARPPVMTLTQAAEYLQVSKAHLSNVINGKVPGVPPVRSVRAGRRVLIKREWIEEWLERADRKVAGGC